MTPPSQRTGGRTRTTSRSEASEKLRALALSVLMVLSMLAVGVSFGPGTVEAANTAGNQTDLEGLPITEDFVEDDPPEWNITGDAEFTNVDETDTLRLTAAKGEKAGTGLYTESFPTTQGITTEIRYYAADGSGADGFTFFLLNESQVNLADFSPGEPGGNLGYSAHSEGGGIPGGYLGVGFDEYGNFADDGIHHSDGPGRTAQSVTIRGAGNEANATDADANAYPHLATEKPDGGDIDGGWRLARITVDPTVEGGDKIKVRVAMSFDEGENWETIIDDQFDSNDIQSDLPEEFLLGFSGSTGGDTNIHAIDSVDVRLPADLDVTITNPPPADVNDIEDEFEYTYQVTNEGPNNASVQVENSLKEINEVTIREGGDQTFDLNVGESKSINVVVDVNSSFDGEDLSHSIIATGENRIDPDPSSATEEVIIQPPVEVSGTVTEALHGAPVENIEVVANPVGNGATSKTATTDVDGNFTLSLRAETDYELSATAQDPNGPTEETFEIADSATIDTSESNVQNLELKPYYDGEGTEVSPFEVQDLEDLQQIRYDLSAYYELQNDINGSETEAWFGGDGFDLIGGSDEKFTGTFDWGGYDITGLTVFPSVEVSGTVTESLYGAPVENAEVVANPVGNEAASETTTTDEEGEFILSLRAESDYELSATAQDPNGPTEAEPPFEIADSATIDTSDSVTQNLELEPDYEGEGTEDSPFEVQDLEDLQQIRYNLSAYYELQKNIDASETEAWFGGDGFDPIGGSDEQFTGTFEGDDYKITSLTINRADQNNIGLFGRTSGVITNVTLTDAEIRGGTNVGGLVGYYEGSATDDSTTFDEVEPNNVVLISDGSQPVTVTGDVSAPQGYDIVGNVVTEQGENVIADGNEVRTETGEDVVAIDGDRENELVINRGVVFYIYDENSYLVTEQDGDVVVSDYGFDVRTADKGNDVIRGGFEAGPDITGSTVKASVEGTDHVGGLIGQNLGGEITESYATGSVEGTDKVGGLVGSNVQKSTDTRALVKNSYATGHVTGNGSEIGGLIGFNNGSWVNSSYAVGAVSGGTNAGGLVGNHTGAGGVTDAYWDTETTTQNGSAGGTGLTTDQLRANTTLFDNFSNTWDVVDNTTHVSYPYVQANTQTPAPGLEVLDSDPPAISNVTVTNPSGQDVQVSFESDEQLAAIDVSISGAESATLSTEDFSETDNGDGTYTYESTYAGSSDGTYTATLETAEDDAGNDGATGHSESVAVSTDSGGSVSPPSDTTAPAISQVTASATADGNINVTVESDESLSTLEVALTRSETQIGSLTASEFTETRDGDSYSYSTVYSIERDGIYTVSVESAQDAAGNDGAAGQSDTVPIDTTPPTAVAGTNQTVNVTESVSVNGSASTDAVGIANYSWTFEDGPTVSGVNATQTYAVPGIYIVTLTVTDEAGHADTDTLTITVEDTVPPTVSAFSVSNPADQDVQISFEVDEPLSTIAVSITGAENATLTAEDFTETDTGDGTYAYEGTYAGSSNGTYTATLASAEDAAGNDGATGQSDSVSVTTDDGDDGDTGDGDGEDASDQDATVSVEQNSDGDTVATITNATAGSTVVIDNSTTGGAAIGQSDNITVDSLRTNVTTDREFWLNVSTYSESLHTATGDSADETVEQAARNFENDTGTVAAGYVQVEHNLGESDVSNATFSFSVRQAYLDTLGVGPNEVSLYRQYDGEWSALSTSFVGENTTHYRFEGVSPGYSVFALGTSAPKFDVTDAALAETTIKEDETTTLTATIANRGNADGTHTLSLTADSEEFATETVTVAGQSTATVEFSVERPVGEWELALDGKPVETLVVDEVQQTKDTPTTATDTPTDQTTTADSPTTTPGDDTAEGSPIPWLAGGLGVVVLVVAVLALRHRGALGGD